MESVTLSLPEAYDLALEVLSANGFSADHAAAIARNVTAGERDGCASHGLWRLLGIVDTLRKGKVSPDAEPQIHDQAPGIARADAGGAFSLLAYERALPLLLEKARHNGIAALAINRCVHFSALFADIEPLTEAGLVGLACTPSHAWVAISTINGGLSCRGARRDPAASARRQSATGRLGNRQSGTANDRCRRGAERRDVDFRRP